MIVFYHNPVRLILADHLMVLVADRSCTELSKAADVNPVTKNTLYSLYTPQMMCVLRVSSAELAVLVVRR